MDKLTSLPPGFIGLPPLNLPGHPLLADGRYYFTLPLKLLEAFVDAVGKRRFDPVLLELDRTLGFKNGDHSHCIGFHNDKMISYGLLAEPPSVKHLIAEYSKEIEADPDWQATPYRQDQPLLDLDARSHWMRDICRGYCGWLLLNPMFIHEQADFLTQWKEVIQELGLTIPPLNEPPTSRHLAFASARESFLERWQLSTLVGPFLPAPYAPQMPVSSPTIAAHLLDRGTLIFFPAIFPMPERQLLRQMIEDTMRRRQSPEHLKEWINLVESDVPEKKTILRLGRLFRLQHFWRTLFARHAQAAAGKLDQVRAAVASYLIPEVEAKKGAASIEKDLGDLSKAHGGVNWFKLPPPCDPIA